jgi:hypothetical protein
LAEKFDLHANQITQWQCNFFSVNIRGRFHWDDELSLSG